MPVCPDCKSDVTDIEKATGHDRSCVGVMRREIHTSVMKLLPQVLVEHGYSPPLIESISVRERSPRERSLIVHMLDGRALAVETMHFARLSQATLEQLK